MIFNAREDEDKTFAPCLCRVLSVYSKQINKWWVHGKKIPWNPGDAKENKKKHRVSILIVNETVCEPYEDFTILLKTKFQCECSSKEMTRFVDRNDVKDATNHLFAH